MVIIENDYSRDEEVKRLYERGWDYRMIAKKMGLSRTTVSERVHSLNRCGELELRPEHRARGGDRRSQAAKEKVKARPTPTANYSKDGRLWKWLARAEDPPT